MEFWEEHVVRRGDGLQGEMGEKLSWQGRLTFVQPRIRLLRSFDQRSHSYLGYSLGVQGTMAGREGEFVVGIGKAAQAKHLFRVGDVVKGESQAVADPRTEPVEFYKTRGLRLIERGRIGEETPPPWRGIPPALAVYRERGHRRLDVRTYEKKCRECLWGCRMPVEIIVDQWNPGAKRYRFETFCYGPKSCPLCMANK